MKTVVLLQIKRNTYIPKNKTNSKLSYEKYKWYVIYGIQQKVKANINFPVQFELNWLQACVFKSTSFSSELMAYEDKEHIHNLSLKYINIIYNLSVIYIMQGEIKSDNTALCVVNNNTNDFQYNGNSNFNFDTFIVTSDLQLISVYQMSWKMYTMIQYHKLFSMVIYLNRK